MSRPLPPLSTFLRCRRVRLLKDFGHDAPRFLGCLIEGKTMLDSPTASVQGAPQIRTARCFVSKTVHLFARAVPCLGLATLLACGGCSGGPEAKLEGTWVGDRIDNVSAEQLARATAWVKATTLEFAGDKLTVTIPTEPARKGTFKVAKVDGEKLVLSACIINDEGRAWGRSGVGAVMGSKQLKAVTVKGKQTVPVADPERVKQLRKEYMKKHVGAYDLFKDFAPMRDEQEPEFEDAPEFPEPLAFRVSIKSDPEKLLKGTYQATVTQRGPSGKNRSASLSNETRTRISCTG